MGAALVAAAATSAQDSVSGDEYEVYAAFLGRDTDTRVAPPILLLATTADALRESDDVERVVKTLYERASARATPLAAAPEMVESFSERRSLETELELVRFRRPRIEVIPREEFDAIRDVDDRRSLLTLRQGYSMNVVTSLSRVAFNTEKTQALLGVSTWAGPSRSEGRLLLLRRDADGWAVVAMTTVWMTRSGER